MSNQDRSGGGRGQGFGFGRGSARRDTGHRSSHEAGDPRTSALVPVDPVDDSGKRARTGYGESLSGSGQYHGLEGQRTGRQECRQGGRYEFDRGGQDGGRGGDRYGNQRGGGYDNHRHAQRDGQRGGREEYREYGRARGNASGRGEGHGYDHGGGHGYYHGDGQRGGRHRSQGYGRTGSPRGGHGECSEGGGYEGHIPGRDECRGNVRDADHRGRDLEGHRSCRGAGGSEGQTGGQDQGHGGGRDADHRDGQGHGEEQVEHHGGAQDEGHRNDLDVRTTADQREGRRAARRGQRMERFDLVQIRTAENRRTKSKQGTSGIPINLVANFFPLVKRPTWCLYKYDVDFKPEEKQTSVKKTLLESQKQSIGAYIFDGSTMYTSHRLAPDPMILYSTKEGDTEKIQMTIKNVGELDKTDVAYLQFYNIIVRKCLETLHFEQIGRQFYERGHSISMPHHRLEILPGYLTTIRQFEHKVMMCVDVIHKVVRRDTCLTLIRHHRNDKEAIAKELIGCIVMTQYNRKTYRIDDIAWDKSPADTFDMRGTDITYFDYYAKKNIHIENKRQPLLVSRPKKRDTHRGETDPIYLIPELCQMTGIPNETRSNFNAMKEFATHLHQPPDIRFQNVQSLVRRIRETEEIRKELTTWGLEFGANLTSLTGRTAPKPKIIMKVNNTNDFVEPNERGDWSSAFRNKNMFSVKSLQDWVTIVPQKDVSHVDNLVHVMNTVGRGLGFHVPRPIEVLGVADTRNPAGYIERINHAMAATYRDTLKMIFVILPRNKLDLYAAVKRRCCIGFGIPSQCFLQNNLTNKNLMSIATKVVIQMNAKLGGEPWAVYNPFKNTRLMIIGFDVHHCGKRKGPSVGAVVATTNNDLSTFHSTASFHKNQTELSEHLCTDVTKCLFAYRALNEDHLPGRIIMYRDGVGDGQLNYVFNTELAQIKAALAGVYTSAGQEQPKFTLIIVTKKINARIAQATVNGHLKNPGAGTIVDDIITLPERWDFYLISQHANQGTVSPTAYNVIFDQQGLDADKIQLFTYKLTHMYFNWSGTVSVPAVCQYAHKLAYLTGVALGQAADERLANTLYYL